MLIRNNKTNNEWVNLVDLGVLLHSKDLTETPNTEAIETDNIGGKKTLLGIRYTHRDISAKLLVSSNSLIEFRSLINKLTGLLSGSFQLKFTDNPGQLYKDVYITTAISYEKIVNEAYILEISMTSYDPFRYGEQENIKTMSGIKLAREELIINNGNAIVKPIITITGSADKVNIKANGRTVSYKNLSTVDTIEIDNGKYTVSRIDAEGRTNALANWENNFIELLPGENNILVDGDNINVDVEIRFEDAFL